jgi:hypothetical protein
MFLPDRLSQGDSLINIYIFIHIAFIQESPAHDNSPDAGLKSVRNSARRISLPARKTHHALAWIRMPIDR